MMPDTITLTVDTREPWPHPYPCRRAGVGARARTEGNQTTSAPVLGLAGERKEHDQQPMILEKPPGLETRAARIWTVTVDPAKG
jgi:hypothetical protein